MYKLFISLLLFSVCIAFACAEPKKADVKIENTKPVNTEVSVIKEPEVKAAKAKINGIVIDYKNFPKDSSGKEVWEKKVKTGKADVKVVKDDELNTHVLNLKSDEASYYFQKSLNDLNIDNHDFISWKWKVTKNPKGGDVRRGATDDQAIQVLLAFEGKYVISYIWDPTAPVGYTKDASILFIVAQKVVVLESGDKNLNKWQEIRRNYKADFKKLYGKEAPKLAGVAIQINSQHTDSKCESFLSPIAFEKK